MNDPVLLEPRLAMAESRIRRLEEKIGHLQHFTIGGGSLATFVVLEHYGRAFGMLGFAAATIFLW